MNYKTQYEMINCYKECQRKEGQLKYSLRLQNIVKVVVYKL